jgi:hypothetical protein
MSAFMPTTVQYMPGGWQVVSVDPLGMRLASTYQGDGKLAGGATAARGMGVRGPGTETHCVAVFVGL